MPTSPLSPTPGAGGRRVTRACCQLPVALPSTGKTWIMSGAHKTMARVQSVNVGTLARNLAKDNWTAIDKRPTGRPVWVSAPGTVKGRSGLAGDAIGDRPHHGGDDQAVYAFAREDLDRWQAELGHAVPDGWFGENLT